MRRGQGLAAHRRTVPAARTARHSTEAVGGRRYGARYDPRSPLWSASAPQRTPATRTLTGLFDSCGRRCAQGRRAHSGAGDQPARAGIRAHPRRSGQAPDGGRRFRFSIDFAGHDLPWPWSGDHPDSFALAPDDTLAGLVAAYQAGAPVPPLRSRAPRSTTAPEPKATPSRFGRARAHEPGDRKALRHLDHLRESFDGQAGEQPLRLVHRRVSGDSGVLSCSGQGQGRGHSVGR